MAALRTAAWVLRRKMDVRWILLPLIVLGLAGCLRFGWNRLSRTVPRPVIETLQSAPVEEDTAFLERIGEGVRQPFSRAEQKTIRWLSRRFRELGLEPRGDNGYLQTVEVEAISTHEASLTVGGRRYRSGEGAVIWTQRPQRLVEAASREVVYVGHGIVAPERGRDDYRELDVAGRVVLVWVGDPDLPPAAKGEGEAPDTQGKEAAKVPDAWRDSWYGRWEYKVAEAARRGALGVLLVHDVKATGESWEVWKHRLDDFQLNRSHAEDTGDVRPPLAFVAALPLGAGERILRDAAIRPELALAAARDLRFVGRRLEVPAEARVESRVRRARSFNVVGEIPGRYDAQQSLVLAAEWDGGARSAHACAGLLALARAFGAFPNRPARSVVFVASTLGTRGHLGAGEYAAHPSRPTDECSAAFVLTGDSLTCVLPSELEETLTRAAEVDHHEFEAGGTPSACLDSAALEFARAGIPAAVIPADSEDLRMVLRAAYHLAQSKGSPRWSVDSPFRFYPRDELLFPPQDSNAGSTGPKPH